MKFDGVVLNKSLPAMLILIVISGMAFTWLARPIYDPDFFWHLKTGEWIWSNFAFPLSDPFSFTTPEVLNYRQEFILTSYWLSQIIYHGFVTVFGLEGIVLLRILVVSLFFVGVYIFSGKDKLLWCLISMVSLVAVLEGYAIERPHFFSFLFSFFLFCHLENCLSRFHDLTISKSSMVLLPLMMLLWANMHGGVVIGQGLLVLCLFNVLARMATQNRWKEKTSRLLCLHLCIGLLFSFLAVNAMSAVGAVEIELMSSLMFAANSEFVTALDSWHLAKESHLIVYFVFLAIAAFYLIVNFRGLTFFRAVTVVGVGFYSFSSIRYIPFFLFLSIPVIVEFVEFGSGLRFHKIAVASCVLIIILCYGADELARLSYIRSQGMVSRNIHPVELADEFERLGLGGRLFNLYIWGGYLMWRLGPKSKVMVDGRSLSKDVIKDFLIAETPHLKGYNGNPLWKHVMDKYMIDYMLLPIKYKNRDYSLTFAAAKDANWQTIAVKENAILLGRRGLIAQ
jgi:hypothetical protein